MTTDKAPSVGEFVLVPKVPTPEILAAIKESASEDDYIWTGEDEIPTSTPGDPADIYAAMLAASPSPGAVPQGDAHAMAEKMRSYGHGEAADLIEQQQAALASQAARMAELDEANDARYRWLRDQKNAEEVSSMVRIYNYGEDAYLLDGPELDAAIDALLHGAAK